MVEIKNITEKEEEKIKTRREKIAGYYLDISKLSFAATVLGRIRFDVEGRVYRGPILPMW